LSVPCAMLIPDLMRDPEICFELGFVEGPHLDPFYFRNDYIGLEQRSRTIERGHYVHLPGLHDQHRQFATQWDSQAKGRVERVNRTLQDRLVKELRLADISDIEAANDFLPAFMQRFNERFAVPPTNDGDLHRPLPNTARRLEDILCHQEKRHIGAQLTFHYDRKPVILEKTEVAKGLAGEYVDVFDFADRPLEVRWNRHILPYHIFSKDQRVSHIAIVENKRLGHALALVKAQQAVRFEAKVKTNSEKGGYPRD
jgi:hypothetical protein